MTYRMKVASARLASLGQVTRQASAPRYERSPSPMTKEANFAFKMLYGTRAKTPVMGKNGKPMFRQNKKTGVWEQQYTKGKRQGGWLRGEDGKTFGGKKFRKVLFGKNRKGGLLGGKRGLAGGLAAGGGLLAYKGLQGMGGKLRRGAMYGAAGLAGATALGGYLGSRAGSDN